MFDNFGRETFFVLIPLKLSFFTTLSVGSIISNGLFRKIILNQKLENHQKFGMSPLNLVRSIGTLFGRKVIQIPTEFNDQPIITDDSFLYFQNELNATQAEFKLYTVLTKISSFVKIRISGKNFNFLGNFPFLTGLNSGFRWTT